MKKWSKKGEMGMGTLIIFIAMVLVAAVAAAVLISTTGNLQNKALATGKATTTEVGTSVRVIQLYAEDGSSQSVDEFYEVIKLNSGSDALRFSDMLLTLSLNNATADYEYSSTINCSGDNTTAGGDYGVEYSIKGTSFKSGYLTKGDVAKICFQSPRPVYESEGARVSLVPKTGTPKIVEADLPGLMVDTRVEVFP